MRHHLRANPQLRVFLNAVGILASEALGSMLRTGLNPTANALTFSIDRGNGGRPDLRSQLTLDRATGEIVRWEAFSSYNSGRRLRAWARFTHTGEAGGLLGQTIAVMASAGAALLVVTGLSLGVRRFLAWKGRRVKVLAPTGS